MLQHLYFDHLRRRPWPDEEAARRLVAVDEWYAAHAPLPMSPYACPHWDEIGLIAIAHVRDRWNSEFICMYVCGHRPTV